MSGSDDDHLSAVLKVVLLGEGGVGKSSLMNRYVNDEFDPQCAHTVGVEFLKKEVNLAGRNFCLQVWDTAGQERFRSLRRPFYRGTDILLLVFDVTNKHSFDRLLHYWIKEFAENADIMSGNEDFVESLREFPVVVVGNKADFCLSQASNGVLGPENGPENKEPEKSEKPMIREVQREVAEKWCCENGPFPYVETSAKDALRVQEAFEMAVNAWRNLQKSAAPTAPPPVANGKRSTENVAQSAGGEEEFDNFRLPPPAGDETIIKLDRKHKSTHRAKQNPSVGKSSGGCCR